VDDLASNVSLPTRSARMTKLPVPLTVPPVTLSPTDFSTGSGSPVIIDSSTLDRPSKTTPSTGTLSPGTTRNWSTDLHLVERNFLIAARSNLSGCRRRKIQQRLDGTARAATGAEFEHLAEEYEDDDDGRGLKVDGDLPPCCIA